MRLQRWELPAREQPRSHVPFNPWWCAKDDRCPQQPSVCHVSSLGNEMTSPHREAEGRRGSCVLSIAEPQYQPQAAPARSLLAISTLVPIPSPQLILLEVQALPTTSDFVVSCSSVQVRLLLLLAAQLSVKSAVALSSSPVHVFVLLLSGCGGVFSLFNCLRCTSVDLFVVLLPLIQSSHTHTHTKKQTKKPQIKTTTKPKPRSNPNKKGSAGRK